MQIDPKTFPFWKLLSNRLFRIPAYQRGYSWQTKQREDLFNDLINLYLKKHDYHFMATIVGLKTGTKMLTTDEYEVIDIVDGQQRLTTLVLLLKAIERKLSKGKDKKSLKKQLCKEDDYTLLLLQMNHDYNQQYANYIREGTLPKGDFDKQQADYNLIRGILDVENFVDHEWTKKTDANLIELLALIKNKLYFLYHQLSDEKLVYTVFEVLNSRGLPVAWLDRTKAMLMGVVFEQVDNSQEMINDLHNIWGDIYQELGLFKSIGSEALRFTATLWLKSEQNRVLNEEDSLETFRQAALEEPNLAIEISKQILDISCLLKKLHADLERSAVTKIAHARLLAVVLMKKYPDDEYLMEQWERVSFRIFGLYRKDSRTKIGDYVRLATKVNADTLSAFEVMRGLLELGEQYDASEAAEQLRKANCYENWQEELRYFFYARERWLLQQNNNKNKNIGWDKIWLASAASTVEHIYPQSADDGIWKDPETKENSEPSERLCHWLGNLTLLPPDVNSSLGRKLYLEKIQVYRQQGLQILDEIIEKAPEKWEQDSIEQREEELIEWAAERWGDL